MRGCAEGLAPVAEAASRQILTLPMYHALTRSDVGQLPKALERVTA
jgi:dTDP-4-amino-4,6-dideoxygalactose transaminase